MALVKGTNSYVDIAEADAYFEDRVNSGAWLSDFSAEDQEQAIVTATGILDDMMWLGYSTSETQSLAFPRVVRYYDPRLGRKVSLTGDETEAPLRVKNATFELAFHLLENEDILSSTSSVDSLAVGALTLRDIRPPSVVPQRVRKLVAPLIANSSRSVYVGS